MSIARYALGLAATAAVVTGYLLLPAAPSESAPPSENAPSAKSAASASAPAVTAQAAKPTNDERFHARLLEIARDYSKWSRVDAVTRWAPLMCRVPPPPTSQFSRSDDADTHGQKMYSLLTNNVGKYLDSKPHADETAPALLVMVKESWRPVDVTGREHVPSSVAKLNWPNGFYPYAKKGDRIFKTGEKAELFIMMQVPADTPGSDEGWVYGTVSADGKTVTGAGRMESCMSCHVPSNDSAKRHLGRLFGLPDERKAEDHPLNRLPPKSQP